MAQVSVRINNRPYQIACDDGQEANLARLADYVDKRVSQLVAAVGQIGDDRLLVMASLLIADELSDAFVELKALKGGGDKTPQSDDKRLESASERIEQLAERLEQP